jgi:hypothetical protein
MASAAPNYWPDNAPAPNAAHPWANFQPSDAWTPPREPGRGLRLAARFFIGIALACTVGVIQGIISGHTYPGQDALYAIVAVCIAAVLREIAYLKRSVADN